MAEGKTLRFVAQAILAFRSEAAARSTRSPKLRSSRSLRRAGTTLSDIIRETKELISASADSPRSRLWGDGVWQRTRR